MDVGIIVDSSSSVRRQNFGKVQKFLVEFVSILKKLDANTHIGLVRYNHKSQLIFNFKGHQDDVLDKLKTWNTSQVNIRKNHKTTRLSVKQEGLGFSPSFSHSFPPPNFQNFEVFNHAIQIYFTV